MKTAVSLPDKVFYAAEKQAEYMGISRSALYLNAINEYLAKNDKSWITKKLNEVYGDPANENYLNEFEPMMNASLETLRELLKDDTW
jgi:adenine-specific DNA methylase